MRTPLVKSLFETKGGREAGRQKDREAEGHADGEAGGKVTGRQRERQAGSSEGRETGRLGGREESKKVDNERGSVEEFKVWWVSVVCFVLFKSWWQPLDVVDCLQSETDNVCPTLNHSNLFPATGKS